MHVCACAGGTRKGCTCNIYWTWNHFSFPRPWAKRACAYTCPLIYLGEVSFEAYGGMKYLLLYDEYSSFILLENLSIILVHIHNMLNPEWQSRSRGKGLQAKRPPDDVGACTCAVGRQMDWLITVPMGQKSSQGGTCGFKSLMLYWALLHLRTLADLYTRQYACTVRSDLCATHAMYYQVTYKGTYWYLRYKASNHKWLNVEHSINLTTRFTDNKWNTRKVQCGMCKMCLTYSIYIVCCGCLYAL